jgi:hypothetical protein
MDIHAEHKDNNRAADPEKTTLLVSNPAIYITPTQLLSSPNLTYCFHKNSS